jgi:signal recognition particle subunit SRP54
MFDQLSDRLQETLSGVRSRGKLSEADVDRAMREIRLVLLEADVNFRVVKQFTSRSGSAAWARGCSRASIPASRW